MYHFLPLGKYQYKRLPMGVANWPDIFQYKMNNLFHIFELINANIYDILILSKGNQKGYAQKL